jgi:hypothetical protein
MRKTGSIHHTHVKNLRHQRKQKVHNRQIPVVAELVAILASTSHGRHGENVLKAPPLARSKPRHVERNGSMSSLLPSFTAPSAKHVSLRSIISPRRHRLVEET